MSGIEYKFLWQPEALCLVSNINKVRVLDGERDPKIVEHVSGWRGENEPPASSRRKSPPSA
jgi:hypothetical protein